MTSIKVFEKEGFSVLRRIKRGPAAEMFSHVDSAVVVSMMNFGRQIVSAILLIMGFTISANAETLPRGVLIISETAAESPFAHRFVEQIHLALDARTVQPYQIYTEYLDFGHFAGPSYDATLHTYFREKYRDEPIRVIVALGTQALQFVSHLRSEIWQNTSVLFVTFDHLLENGFKLPSNTTGIIATRRFQDLVTSARLFVPKLGTVVLVGGPLDRQPLRDGYQKDVQQFAKELNITDLTGRSIGEVRKRVAVLPDDAVIVYLPIYTDETGISHNPQEAIKAVSEVANRPIVIDSEDLVGSGATGGFIVSARKIGDEVGARIARILNGEDVANIQVATRNFIVPMFDARKLKEWGIGEHSLPIDSDVRFREQSIWDLYAWQILAVAMVIPIQSFLIGWFLYEHRRRQRAERESRQHLLEAAKMDRAMMASAMSASIAHELNQPLGAILNNAETAEILLNKDSTDRNELKEILADIRRDDQRAAEIIRGLRMLLKHSDLEAREIELADVITDTIKLVEHQAIEHGVTIKVAPLPARLRVRADPIHLQQVLLNIALNAIEAMQNIPEGARELKVRVDQLEGGEARVSIEDNGPGIPVEKLKRIFEPFVTTKRQGTGIGLSIAKTIIGTYGGRIWAENVPNGGAIFHFTLRVATADLEAV